MTIWKQMIRDRKTSRLLLACVPLFVADATLGASSQAASVPPAVPTASVARSVTMDPEFISASGVVLAFVDPRKVPPALAQIRWTAPIRRSVSTLAADWGMSTEDLLELNPTLDEKKHVQPGTTLTVFRFDPKHPTQSVGAPNAGKLIGGMPLPEGRYWKLRDNRRRAYGSQLAVATLLYGFNEYGQAFENPPKLLIGELSHRTGGRAAPHSSHRTGRDIDIGYVLRGDNLPDHRWVRASAKNLDVEKTWFLIRTLVETGNVQTIFVSSKLQPLIYDYAAQLLDETQLARYFRVEGYSDPRTPPIIMHAKGHRDHMHVRFVCEPWNKRCSTNSRGRSSRRAERDGPTS